MKVWSGNWDIILIFKICHSIISKCAFICPTFHGMSFIFALQHQFCLIVNYTNQDNSRNVQFNNGGIKITIEFCILPCSCAWGSFILKCTLYSTKKPIHTSLTAWKLELLFLSWIKTICSPQWTWFVLAHCPSSQMSSWENGQGTCMIRFCFKVQTWGNVLMNRENHNVVRIASCTPSHS